MNQEREFLKNRIIDKSTILLMEEFQLDMQTALDFIYNSDTYTSIREDETGLYLESPSYVYEYLKKEYLTAKW